MESYTFAAVAAIILLFSVTSGPLRRSSVTPPMLFAGIGWLLAPQVCGVIHLDVDTELVRTLAELTLVLILFVDAARIELAVLKKQAFIPIRLLGVGMPLMIGFGTITAYWIFGSLSIWECALLATMLAPTDAALGKSVVEDERLPSGIRQGLSVESGLNDGIAYPIALFFLACASMGEHLGTASEWTLFITQQIGFGVIVGLIVGYLGAQLLIFAKKRGWIVHPFEELSLVSIALLSYSVAEIMGGNGFVSAYVGGLAIGFTARHVCTCIFDFAESEGAVLTILIFLIFGATMLWQLLDAFHWAPILYAALSLTVIRMASVGIALWDSGLHRKTILFMGWFGPRGLASVLFALLILPQHALAGRQTLFITIAAAILMSIYAHGLTAYPLTTWFANFTNRLRETVPNSSEFKGESL